ncbi:hypothetical protein STCU_06891 [Strigomonas culicis]|uniref:Haloacid dehalogenase-like hydrolase n=1 Tax=Strigomonas culicis TaxID=28005 RepID=S9U872_9TRYP|nr:hypothetical protein STCU_06891 [Strigomonas culicis]|eukprot:EPY25004.1 hypothetical protein STCU_06891 [Strigomonas culicis]
MYDPLALVRTYEAETGGAAAPDADLEARTCLSGVSKVFFGCEHPHIIQELRGVIERQFTDGGAALPLSITSSSPYVMEITAADTTKVTGLEALLPYIPVPAGVHLSLSENAIAFGDGENDVEMLRAVRQGYLMGNAREVVRTLVLGGDPTASGSPVEVIESNVNDGVAKKLTELFLSN